ncbi:MAG: hypothetical protein J0H70_04210 [Microbacterium chocolatum]|nr:hypothetical protein [Microbacterium chocolatum]
MNRSSAHAEYLSSRADPDLIDEADVLDAVYADRMGAADRDAWERFDHAQQVEVTCDTALDQLDDLSTVSRRATATQWRVNRGWVRTPPPIRRGPIRAAGRSRA